MDREGGEKRGLGQRAVMRLQPLNSPAGKRKVTDSFIPKIANKPVKRVFKKKRKIFCRICNICCVTYIIQKCLFSFYSCNSPTSIKGCIRHERPLLAAGVLTSVA